MKRKLILSLLAVVPAVLMPLAAIGQVAPSAGTAAAERVEPSYKYTVYAGYAYTSLNQVNGSRYGLQGVNASVTRDFGKYFGITADGAFYKYALNVGSNTAANPGNPQVDTVLFGPVLHGQLYGPVSGFVDVLLGGEHTGGETVTPKISFAGGFGGGLDYKLSPHFGVRASGDRIASAFSLINNTTGANSPHETWNARATVGLVFRF